MNEKELLAMLEQAAASAEKSLNLGYNRLTDAGAVALAHSPHMAGLQYLDLDSNDITDAVIDLLRLRESFLSIQGPALADAVSADPANLFLLARLFLEQGGVSEGPLFAAIAATPQDSLFWGWLEAKAEQVEDCAVPQALSFFPANARLQQRASFCRRRDMALEAALF